jgi:hypothetical protein
MNDISAGRDDVMDALGLLGTHQPDSSRGARVRACCYAVLLKRRRHTLSSASPGWRRSVEPAVVGTLCAVYLFEVLSRAVLLYRF